MDQESNLLCLQKYVGFPDLIPSSPHRTSSMFALGPTPATTTKASERSSQRVSHITGLQFYSVSLLVALHIICVQSSCGATLFFTACGSNILADDVGGAIASPNYPYPYPNNQQCSWIIVAQEPCA